MTNAEKPTTSTQVPTPDPAQWDGKALFVCYNHCTTCARARKWLGEHNVDFTERNIKTDNPTVEELRRWWKASGLPLKRFFNTSGMPYRELKLKDKLPGMSEDEQLETLASNGMLVKRPIVVSANTVLVGFLPEAWQTALFSTADRLK
ncbi:arsenate reductase family protein [Bifidobacterium sp. ESL0790]|uniref:arsenate reductase family protein n=1 Tax=Bifidobacterium sp. ESL0790 TaxID=2983233 RepID=UPI0023F7DF92|nr:arsenate reductase family protein [Bifidobacterium sp. ESL0790]WEV72883.1 arsenate reductase family protein [Bifidobacterium sp. ESL0790]